MRRLAASATVAAGLICALLSSPTAALAYTRPSGLGADTANVCPARPNDLDTATSSPVPLSGLASIPAGGSATEGPSTAAGGGPESLSVNGDTAGESGLALLEVQDASGAWKLAGILALAPTMPDSAASATFYPPDGPLRIVLENLQPSGAISFGYALAASSADVGGNYAAQELADACVLQESDAAQAHLDSTSSKQVVVSELNATNALDGDVRQLDQDLNSGVGNIVAAEGAGSSPSDLEHVSVDNFPADQTVGLDTAAAGQLDGDAHALHDDFWLLAGALVGCWAFGIVLGRIWP